MAVAKDTEKLIRQLSLISYLMAERRPVTATEIRRDVEGYSDMTEDAFARRFYADRAELDSLGIQLRVDKPADGFSEQENYSLAPEAFHLPAIAFTDEELAALQTALKLLDGEFAYAEPLRLALQQITWGRPSPLDSPEQRSIGLGITASAGGTEVSARLAKIDTAIYRRKRIEFEYYTMQSGEIAPAPRRPLPARLPGRPVLPRRPLARARRRPRLPPLAHPRQGRLRDQGRARLPAPGGLRPARVRQPHPVAARRHRGTAEIWVSDRIAWQVERHFGPYGEMADAEDGDGRVFRTHYAIPRLLIAWALGFGEHARIAGPPELAAEARERLDAIVERHRGEPFTSRPRAARPAPTTPRTGSRRSRARQEAAIRPERFARLVTLASVLIAAGREGRRLPVTEVCERLQISEQELREDISVLNVVNFGGGAYVLYAEVLGERDRGRPRALLRHLRPPGAAAADRGQGAVAAIDLLGDHLPEHARHRAREDRAALGEIGGEGLLVTRADADDSAVARVVSRAIDARRLIELEYYAPNEDRFSTRTVEPYALINGREGWYVATWTPPRRTRATSGSTASSPSRCSRRPTSRAPGSTRSPTSRAGRARARSPTRAPRASGSPPSRRAGRARSAPSLAELPDGAVIIEWGFKGEDYLVKEVLKEAGDAAVLEPADAREAVLHAAERLLAPAA